MELTSFLGYQLSHSSRSMKRVADSVLSDYNLTTSQWSILKLLSETSNMTQNEIAIKLESDKATVGQIIRLLEQNQFISKKPSETDRLLHCFTSCIRLSHYNIAGNSYASCSRLFKSSSGVVIGAIP